MSVNKKKGFVLACLSVLMLLSGGSIYVYSAKSMQYWLLPYIKWELGKENSDVKPKHIMLLICDHFEPSTIENMKKWTKRWPKVIEGHKDADGLPPQYTWCYFIDGYKEEVLEELSKLAKLGLGEIEIQLHHSNDTSETFRQKLKKGKKELQKVGFAITRDGEERFAYIAGNWALDNSVRRGDRNYSGVNNELTVLKEEGCFADFTFPSLNMATPKIINKIYYATDDPASPKSYDTGQEVEAGGTEKGDLMIFQGPVSINLKDWKHKLYPSLNNGNIQAGDPPTRVRVDEWIRVGIHVAGRPDWIFVKCHTHGAHPPIREMLLGNEMSSMFSYLEAKYNDGQNYVLHYVTAREAYNIVKAAEAGRKGNPNQYRDWLIRPYKNRE